MKWMIVLLLGLSYNANSQMNIQVINTSEVIKADSIDEVLFTVQYEAFFTPDSMKPEKKDSEIMLLTVGKKTAAFYSYVKFLTDSIIEADKAAGAPLEVMQEHMKQYNAKIKTSLYKNYPTGKTTTLDQLAMSKFICEESTDMPEWTIHEDTTTILGYVCRKATCYFKGRDYEAWFTTEIPRSEGPWKLQGLPGLILKAVDSRNHYSFICNGLEQSHGSTRITIEKDGRQPISRKDLNKLYERYMADPMAYIASANPNVKITIKDESGNATKGPKNMPYNPIELSVK